MSLQAIRESSKEPLLECEDFLVGSLVNQVWSVIMSQQTFELNSRHVMNVSFNSTSGMCDVVVSEKHSDRTFIKSMVLERYNQLVDWLRDNDHAFAMMSIRSQF